MPGFFLLLAYSHRIPNMWWISPLGPLHRSCCPFCRAGSAHLFVWVWTQGWFKHERMRSYFGDGWCSAGMPLSGGPLFTAPARRILQSSFENVTVDRPKPEAKFRWNIAHSIISEEISHLPVCIYTHIHTHIIKQKKIFFTIGMNYPKRKSIPDLSFLNIELVYFKCEYMGPALRHSG